MYMMSYGQIDRQTDLPVCLSVREWVSLEDGAKALEDDKDEVRISFLV